MPTVSSFFARVFSYYLLFSTTYIITTKFENASAKNKKEEEKKTANKIATTATECSIIKCSF
jgi:hypothetical protein